MHWMRLTVDGTAGHGSMTNKDNAITELCRGGRPARPARVPGPADQDRCAASSTSCPTPSASSWTPRTWTSTLAKLGGIAKMIGATLRNTAQPTMLGAGYKVNVIPGQATAHVDGRFLPGHEEEFLADLDRLLGPRVRREDAALATRRWRPASTARWSTRCRSSLKAEDPIARAVPYMLSGGTDAKSFSDLGIRCFGFAPLRLPPELDFAGMFHGVDERVPVDGLRFGVRVLDRFLDNC